MCGVDNVKHVLPLRLRGRALSVYQQLSSDQQEDLQQVKQALLVAFVPDPFVAFDTFVSCCLCPGKTVDKYLGDLQDLARLIKENTSDRWLSFAFVSGLPGPVRWKLHGSSRMEHMTQEQILARGRWACCCSGWATPGSSSCACGPTCNSQQTEHSHSAVLQVWNSQSLCQRLSAAWGQITKSAPTDTLLSVPATRTCRIKVSGKWGKGREASTTLSPHKLEVLPVMKVKINGMDWIAFVDSGGFSSVVSGMLCRPEVWKNTTLHRK